MAPANLIDGRPIARQLRDEMAGRIQALKSRGVCQKEQQANAAVAIYHSATRNTGAHYRRADILIAAMGVPEFVTADMVKPGAVVVDVGVNRVPDRAAKGGTRLVGDVAFAGVQPVAGKTTPNPGGVGPLTIAMLMQNTVHAAELACA